LSLKKYNKGGIIFLPRRGLFIFLFFFLLQYFFNAQSKKNTRIIDSLCRILKTTKEDTVKTQALFLLVPKITYHNPDSALLLVKQHLSILERKTGFSDKRRKMSLVDCYHNFAIIYKNIANYTLSDFYSNKALTLSLELNDKNLIARTYCNFGNSYADQGDFPKGLDFHFKCLKIEEEIKDTTGIARQLGNIGTLYQSIKDYDKSLEYHLKALKIDEQRGWKWGMARHYGNIGVVYRMRGDYDKALEYYLKAIQMDEEMGNRDGVARHLGNIGVFYKNLEKYDKALEYARKALKMCEELGDKAGVATQLGNIGWIYGDMEKYNECEKYLKSAIDLSHEINAHNLEQAFLDPIIDLYSITGKHELALKSYRRYIHLRDSLFNEENTKKMVRSEMNFEFEKQHALEKAEQDKKEHIRAQEERTQKIVRNSFIAGFVLMLALAFFIFKGYRQKQKANGIIIKQKEEVEKQKHLVEEQKELIEEKQKEILDSINYAQRIQKTILAHDEFLDQNIDQYFVLFKPKDIVSGDFYWATKKDERLYLVVGDSTGHGVPGAFMSLLNIGFLNEAINEKEIETPDKVLNHVRNRLIENISKEGQKDGFDGTLICFDKQKNTIRYASANNNPVILKNKILTELVADKMPVGIGERQDSFKLHTIDAQKNDMLYFFTDGFPDQFGGPKGKKFMYKKLNLLFETICELPLQEQKSELEKNFSQWQGMLEQVDDVCIIGIRI